MSVVSAVSRSTSPYSTITAASQLSVGDVTECVHKILTERECSIFDKGLSTYHKRKDVSALVECLAMVLNTNSKRQLLVPVRDAFVKPSDVLKFNSLAIRHGLAAPVGATGTRGDRPFSGARKIDVKRTPAGEWGFNVRGGSEHGTGVFVSWVDPLSNSHKAGLKIGDQIHKANNTSFEGITHFEATQILKGCKKLRLWVTSHGQIPGVQYATHSYNWVDSLGQPCSPPPPRYQPFLLGHSHSDPSERKVSLIVSQGMELGLSIRGGMEHELGIYVTSVDPGSVAHAYGIKVGDQILEINGTSFLKITHSDAAKALRASRHMVIRLKDVGKVPRSKFSTIGPTNWHKSPTYPEPPSSGHATMSLRQDPGNKRKTDGIVATDPVFYHGAGSQVMLTKTSSPARGIMNDMAKSLLSASEMSTFDYYINQYETGYISIEDFTTALLQLLNTNEKMHLIAEVRNFIQPQDLDLFNSMTIEQELLARKALKQKQFSQSSVLSAAQTSTESDNSSGELDSIPQLLTSSPRHSYGLSGLGEDDLAGVMRVRRGKVGESMATSDSWEETNFHSSSQTGGESLQQKIKEIKERTRKEVEESLRKETERKLKEEFELEQQKLLLETSREIEEKQRKKYTAEKEALEKRLKSLQEQEISKIEESVWREAEERIRQELEDEIRKESEKQFAQEYKDRLQQELRKFRRQAEAEKRRKEEEEKRKHEIELARMEAEEQERLEMEQRIRKEAEEFAKQKYEAQLLRESREKARLAEEVKTYQQIEGKLKDEQVKRKQLEHAKKEAEQKARKEAAEKEELQALLKEREEEMEAELAARDEAEQQRRREQERRRREEDRRRREKERARLEEERRRRDELERMMEETLQKEEMEHELQLQKREDEEVKKKKELQKKKEEEQERQAEEKRKRQEEKRKQEEERVKRDEARARREEEARIRREKEERRKKEEEEARIKREKEERRKKEEEEARIKREKEERKQREEEARIRREEEERMKIEEEERMKIEEEERMRIEEEEFLRREEEEEEEEEERMRIEEERIRREEEARHRRKQQEEKRRNQERQREEERRRKEQADRQRREEERQRQEAMRREQEEQQPLHREAEEETERMHREEQRRQRQAEERRRKDEQQERARQASEEKRRRDEARAQARQAEEARLQRAREVQEAKERAEHEKRLQEEQRRYEEEERRIRAEEHRVSTEVHRLDAAAMDDLVLGLAAEVPPPSSIQPIITPIKNKQRYSTKESIDGEQRPRSNSQIIEEERQKAEKMLAHKLRQDKQQQAARPPSRIEGTSYGGYTGLKGKIITVNVTKVTRKLGIAVDGGSNTKQKAVIIRHITPDGSAGLTGIGLETDQQILTVNGKSLKGLKHKEAVLAIKTAFEGPINKVIEFVVCDPNVEEE